jgi:hypothetical protein
MRNYWIIKNDELDESQVEAVVTYFKVSFRNFAGGTEEILNQKNLTFFLPSNQGSPNMK